MLLETTYIPSRSSLSQLDLGFCFLPPRVQAGNKLAPAVWAAGEAGLTLRFGWRSGAGLRTPPGPRRKLLPRYMMSSSGQTGAQFILDSDRVPAKARALGDKETKKQNQNSVSEGLGVANLAPCSPAFMGLYSVGLLLGTWT